MPKRFNAEFVLGFLAGMVFLLMFVGWLSAYSPSEAQKAECREAADKFRHKIDECETFWERSTSDPVALFTLVLAVSTVGLWVATGALYVSGERQIDIAVRSTLAAEKAAQVATSALIGGNRAWVKVSAALADSLKIDGDDITALIALSCDNAGNAPALELSHHIWFRPWNVQAIKPADDIRSTCENARSESTFHNFVLFAGEKFPDMTEGQKWNFLTRLPALSVWDVDGKNHARILLIMGCVNYKFPTDPERMHQTRFMYELTKSDGSEFERGDFPLSQTEVRLRKTILAAGYFAD